MSQYSRTGQTFQRRDTYDGEILAPPTGSSDPGYLRRLAWRTTPRIRTNWTETVNALGAEEQIDVFCDNGIFADDAHADLWEVLLAAPGRMILTPRVLKELLPWLKIRPGHRVLKALKDEEDGVRIINEPQDGEPGKCAFDYYMSLLKIRRGGLEIARRAFRKEHGRDPNEAEDRDLLGKIQQSFGDRGRLIGGKEAGLLTDEALVYLAVRHAVTTGRQTLVLTRDADVEEQFFKLLWLVLTHYMGMLLAEHYVGSTGAFRTRPFPVEFAEPDSPFVPDSGVLVERDASMHSLLPADGRFVAISCWNSGVYTSTIAFGGETGMRRLLGVKDATGGLSTNLLNGRNVHASISPAHARLPGRSDYAAIAVDYRKPVSSSGATVARLDIWQALVTKERHSKLVETGRRSAALRLAL